MCKKKIKINDEFGHITGYKQCSNDVFKQGFCKKHYLAFIRRLTPFGKRIGYVEVLKHDFENGKSMLLKTDNNDKNKYKHQKGVIYKFSKPAKFTPTDIPPDITLFCYKNTNFIPRPFKQK